MDITRIIKKSDTAATPAGGRNTSRPPQSGEAFSRLIERKGAELAEGLDLKEIERNAQAEKAAGDLVSNALILPMLKQLRRSCWKENSLFSGGIGEKTFGPEFDMQIADRIAHSPQLGVKVALANRLLHRNASSAAKQVNGSTLDLHG